MDRIDEFAVKYPFSESARGYLERANITSVSEKELEGAKERVIRALKDTEQTGRFDANREVVSYVLSRILLGAINNHAVNAKFAGFESKRALTMLKAEDFSTVEEIGREFFPSLKVQGPKIEITTLDYLRYGSDLANERVGAGVVYFERGEFMQLLRRAIEVKIADISFNAKNLPPNIRKFAESIRAEVESNVAIDGKFAGSFKGKYMSLPAMQRILQGLPEGKRYYGSMTLAIACLKDGISKENAEQVLITYARNCGKSTHSYSEREALASLEWVYRHPTINFSMKTLREQGLVDDETLRQTERQYGELHAKPTATPKSHKLK